MPTQFAPYLEATISPLIISTRTPASLDGVVSASQINHHTRYYLDDGLIFLVENTLFKIPRYMLAQESSVFADMFRLPSGNRSEGKTDSLPIQLLQVAAIDFERLLELLYPKRFSEFTTSTNHWGETEWKSILHLSSRWQMSEIYNLSIVHLTSCATPFSKIALGRQYDLPAWVRDGFLRLCLRTEPLRMGETDRLSLQDVLGVASARERIRSEVMRSTCHLGEWAETKYGRSVVYMTRQDSTANYLLSVSSPLCRADIQYTSISFIDPMVHLILDETFGLEEDINMKCGSNGERRLSHGRLTPLSEMPLVER
ncbi:hypothetical protein K439DRAFT_1412514 [Ramaria rubella]|nr:hypothetical protein K439DRAFT_1412514 [Ramaria rubella]